MATNRSVQRLFARSWGEIFRIPTLSQILPRSRLYASVQYDGDLCIALRKEITRLAIPAVLTTVSHREVLAAAKPTIELSVFSEEGGYRVSISSLNYGIWGEGERSESLKIDYILERIGCVQRPLKGSLEDASFRRFVANGYTRPNETQHDL